MKLAEAYKHQSSSFDTNNLLEFRDFFFFNWDVTVIFNPLDPHGQILIKCLGQTVLLKQFDF